MALQNRYWQKIKPALLLSTSVLLLGGCATLETAGISNKLENDESLTQNTSFVNDFPAFSIDQIAQNASNDVFKIGDVADINVYNVESLTNTYVVDRAGEISFPLIGTVRVAGLSTTKLQETLTQRYGSRYLESPSINVKLETQTLGRIVVDGAVRKPGAFEVNEIIRLSEAIALAEGLNEENTNGSKVYIVRGVNGQRQVKEVDLRAIRQLGADDPQLIPEDVIFVQDSTGRILFKEFLKTVPLINTAVLYGTRN